MGWSYQQTTNTFTYTGTKAGTILCPNVTKELKDLYVNAATDAQRKNPKQQYITFDVIINGTMYPAAGSLSLPCYTSPCGNEGCSYTEYTDPASGCYTYLKHVLGGDSEMVCMYNKKSTLSIIVGLNQLSFTPPTTQPALKQNAPFDDTITLKYPVKYNQG